MRFWLGWNEYSRDYRPLTSPPGAAILGWWCSGHADEYSTLCALVEAESEPAAWAAVATDWPHVRAREVRFCKEVSAEFQLSDRFPLSDWMLERVGKWLRNHRPAR